MRRNTMFSGVLWLTIGAICLYLNFRYGASILMAIPGIISGKPLYMSLMDANLVEFVFMAFEFLLALGFINLSDGLSPWEWVLLVCGMLSSLIDVWANTVPWIVGNAPSDQLMKVYNANIFQVVNHGNFWEMVILVLVLVFGVVVGLGGEVCLAQAYKCFFPTVQSRN